LEQNEGVTDKGVVELLRSPVMKGLRYLSLSYGPQLTDRAAIALAESPNAANLRVLFLNRAGFGDQGATALAESPYLHRLEMLVMFETNTRKSGPAGKAIVERFGARARF
jgi:hypothetical protein